MVGHALRVRGGIYCRNGWISARLCIRRASRKDSSFYVPDGYTGAALYQRNPRLFDSEFVKDRYAMDAYFVQLNHARTEEIIEQSIYWYSIWSHTRTGQWKGCLQVDLSPGHDAAARVKLETGRQ